MCDVKNHLYVIKNQMYVMRDVKNQLYAIKNQLSVRQARH